MNLIRIRHTPARRATPPGTGQLPATQCKPHRPHPAREPARDGFARRFIQDLAAAAGVGRHRPAPATENHRRHTMTTPFPQLHTIQLCIHCRQNPAGFWVSRDCDQTVRRPWCLSCCQDLDPASHHIRPFDLQYLR